MAVLTLVVELFLLVGPWDTEAERIQVMFAVALVFAAFYAMGSGATLFAAEREAETYEFLRALPVTPLKVFAGKVAFALASTAALFGAGVDTGAGIGPQTSRSAFSPADLGDLRAGGHRAVGLGNLFLLIAEASIAGSHFCGDRHVVRCGDPLVGDLVTRTWICMWISFAGPCPPD